MEPNNLAERKPRDPMDLLAIAIEKGISAESINRLYDLYERDQTRRREDAFALAMAACQREMPTIVKDAENTQTRSTYALLETVQRLAKPVYTAHGFALSFAEADCPLPNFKRTICDVRHEDGHCVRYHCDLPVDGIGPKGNPIGGMNAVQGNISSGSYAERVLIKRIFNLTIAGQDDDGNGAGRSWPLTPAQVQTINNMIEACTNSGVPILDMKKFFVFAANNPNAGSLADVTQDRFDAIVAELSKRLRKAKAQQ